MREIFPDDADRLNAAAVQMQGEEETSPEVAQDPRVDHVEVERSVWYAVALSI